MVTQKVHLITIYRVFDIEPHFLIKKEHHYIVQEWYFIWAAQVVVTTSCDTNCAVAWKVAHCMAEARCRRLSLYFELCKLTMYNFSINDDWFEITQLVLELTFDVLTSEEINSFLD